MKRPIAVVIYLIVAGILLAFVFSLTANAVRLTSDADEDQRVVPVPPPPPPPSPPVRHPLALLLQRLRVEGPYAEAGLAIWVLTLDGHEPEPDFITMDEGVASGDLIIQELAERRVSDIRILNRGRVPAFLMAGELVAGGLQNRTVRLDTVIPPGGDAWLSVPVYCVEQHRWRGASEKFDAAKEAAPNAVRMGLSAGGTQEQVWREVERAQTEAGIDDHTGDVTSLYRDEKAAAAIGEATRRIIDRIPRFTSPRGLVIARDGRIVSADVFASSHLYYALREKVIRSHVVEVWRWKHHPPSPDAGDVRAFLGRIRSASISESTAPGGYGTRLTIGRGICGTGILYGGDVVHAALFPEAIYRPLYRGDEIPAPRREE